MNTGVFHAVSQPARRDFLTAATGANGAEAPAKPLVHAGKAGRDQFQAQKDPAQHSFDLKAAIAQLPAAITPAETALPDARKAGRDFHPWTTGHGPPPRLFPSAHGRGDSG
jgi:hypothetical protein